MATFSLCMIVKNEESVLARCLDSVADLMDEIIIVDTGSTDRTKEIARKYTDKIYDFAWTDDFAAARNFSFSKATMDYIYAPDADEVLDAKNHDELKKLKQVLMPEVEIVQMKYRTVTEFNTVLNAATEYRPKLFKRQREFVWIDPIHETVRLEPVVYDSDIEILHMPQSMHSKRDFSIFEKTIARDGSLSDKLLKMYAMELEKSGEGDDLERAVPFFEATMERDADADRQQYARCILAKAYRLRNEQRHFLKVTLKDMVQTPCAEICFELGEYFLAAEDYSEAALWFYNAAYETEAVLDIHRAGDLPLRKLLACYQMLLQQDNDDNAKQYYRERLDLVKQQLEQWQLPEE